MGSIYQTCKIQGPVQPRQSPTQYLCLTSVAPVPEHSQWQSSTPSARLITRSGRSMEIAAHNLQPWCTPVAQASARRCCSVRQVRLARRLQRQWKLRASQEPAAQGSADPEWDKAMSVFRSRKNKPSQLELLRRLEEESEIGKVCHTAMHEHVNAKRHADVLPPLSTSMTCCLRQRRGACNILNHEFVNTRCLMDCLGLHCLSGLDHKSR